MSVDCVVWFREGGELLSLRNYRNMCVWRSELAKVDSTTASNPHEVHA